MIREMFTFLISGLTKYKKNHIKILIRSSIELCLVSYWLIITKCSEAVFDGWSASIRCSVNENDIGALSNSYFFQYCESQIKLLIS